MFFAVEPSTSWEPNIGLTTCTEMEKLMGKCLVKERERDRDKRQRMGKKLTLESKASPADYELGCVNPISSGESFSLRNSKPFKYSCNSLKIWLALKTNHSQNVNGIKKMIYSSQFPISA